MADYRLGGDVDFSWLGNLPAVAGAAQDRQTRRNTLSDLKSGDADSLLAAGSRLIAAGDLEGGLKLIAEGRQRKAVDVRADELSIYRNLPGLNIPGMTGGAGAAPPSGPVTFPGGNAPPPAAPAPDLFQGRPGAIPGVTAVPPPPGPQQAAGPSPSDAIIAAAQQPPPTPPGTQQLAGPPPTPNTLPGQTPVMSAETLNAAAARAVPAAPAPEGPGVRLEPPSAQGVRPNQTPPEVMRNIGNIASEMAKTPPKASGRLKALSDLMKQQIELTHWDADTKKFMVDQADRRAAGEPVQSRSQWEAENKTLETTYKSALKKYDETYSAETDKARSLKQVLDSMEGITTHPQFASGAGTPIFAQAVSALSALRDTALSLGVSKNKIPDIEKLTTPAALQEAFTALSNQAIYAKLGSLGNQISEGDRNFIKLAFPSLSLTKEGNLFLMGIMQRMADNAIKNGAVATQYMEQAGPRASSVVMDRLVREAAENNSILAKKGPEGKYVPTDAGAALKEATKQVQQGTFKFDGGAQAAPQTVPAAPAAPAARPRPLNGPKTPENPEGRYLRLPDGSIVPENQT